MSFKICTIGCGRLATKVHGPSYKKYAEEYSNTVLAACCDMDEEKARQFKENFGFQTYYTDLHEMLDTEKPDAVCLVVPEALTARLAVEVLKKQVPLMMEKPPGLSREETSMIVEAARQHATPAMVAFNRRHAPIFKELKRLLSDPAISPHIHSLRYDFYRVGRKDPDFETTAIHGIDIASYLLGSSYKKVEFQFQELPMVGKNVCNILMQCEFESGAIAQLNFCPVSGYAFERATVTALDHTFIANLPISADHDKKGKLLHYKNNKRIMELNGDELERSEERFITNGFYGENETFFQAIRNGKTTDSEVENALQVVDLADHIRLRISNYKSIHA